MTEPTARIRWTEDRHSEGPSGSRVIGRVGELEADLFSIYPPDERSPNWLLAAQMPGLGIRFIRGDNTGELKAQAEESLAEFVTSLGAVFPDALVADLRSRADELEMTVAHNASHERDKHLFAAGLKRGADLIERGDQPEVSEAPAPSVPSGTGTDDGPVEISPGAWIEVTDQ